MQNTVIIIAGPTAVGKTAVAIDIARHFKTEIISADSRQCYREMNIGVARPSPEELALASHHFIASHSIHEKVNAVTFEKYALEKANDLFKTKQVVVMVGGTGLYIKAFCEGLDDISEIPEIIRNEIITAYQLNGIEWLQAEVARLDPSFFDQSEQQNPHRLMRALEVIKATGRSILTYRVGAKAQRPFAIKKLALELPREVLYQRINTRVDQMLQMGLEEEVRSLIPYQKQNALQTVGYKELFEYFDGEIAFPDAVATIKQNTRHYAKRQLTWFRKDKDYHWFSPEQRNLLFTWLEKEVT